MNIGKYVKPSSVEEAWALLKGNEGAAIIGGGAWLRRGGRKLELAIDLFETGLDTIRTEDGRLEIGAMATYRQLETAPDILDFCDGLIARSVRDIVGVQMRNIFTVGGTVAGRFGFSHLNCALLALEAQVEFHEAGLIPLEDHLDGKGPRQDILTKVVVDGSAARGSFQAVHQSRNDFATLAVAVVRNVDRTTIAVGARPGQARLAESAMAHLVGSIPDGKEEILTARAGELAAEEINFGDDQRASAEYRRMICPVLVERALKEVLK